MTDDQIDRDSRSEEARDQQVSQSIDRLRGALVMASEALRLREVAPDLQSTVGAAEALRQVMSSGDFARALASAIGDSSAVEIAVSEALSSSTLAGGLRSAGLHGEAVTALGEAMRKSGLAVWLADNLKTDASTAEVLEFLTDPNKHI